MCTITLGCGWESRIQTLGVNEKKVRNTIWLYSLPLYSTPPTLQDLTREFRGRENVLQILATKWSEEKLVGLNPFNCFVYIQFPNNPLRMSDQLANSSASLLTSRLVKISWCTWQRATAVNTDIVHYRRYSSMTVKKWRRLCPVRPPHWQKMGGSGPPQDRQHW